MFFISKISQDIDLEDIIDGEGLFDDPENKLTAFLLYVYSMETFIPLKMQRIQLEKDIS